MKSRWLLSLLTILALVLVPLNSSAIENGTLLSNDENAVYLLDGSVNAFLYKPQIAFTSAHGTAEWGRGELFVNTSSGKKVKLERILLSPGFKERSVSQEVISTGKAVASRSNDFAILILAEPIPMTKVVELIKPEELVNVLRNQEPVYAIGYSSFDSTRIKDQRPRLLEARIIEKESAKQIYEKYYSISHPNWGPRGANFELTDIELSHSAANGSGCDGDSGNGYFIKRGDKKVYLGPGGAHSVGIPNCGKPGYWGEFGNAFAIEPVFKHLDLIREAEIIVEEMVRTAQAKTTTTATKTKTITCIKGKKIRKVTAVKPQCPVGYKKK